MADPFTFFAVVSTVLGFNEQRKAKKATKRANIARENIERIRGQRQKQQQVKKSRILRAQVTAQAESGAAEGSSAVAGAKGSITSQLASNVSFLDNLQNLGDFIGAEQASAAKSLGRAATLGAISSVVGAYAGGSSGGTQGSNIFDDPNTVGPRQP